MFCAVVKGIYSHWCIMAALEVAKINHPCLAAPLPVCSFRLPKAFTQGCMPFPVQRNAADVCHRTITHASKGFGAPPKPVKKPSTPAKEPIVQEPCPCASGKIYKNCCEPAHAGTRIPETPEAALRARFSAYVKGKEDFLVNTTHPDYHTYHYEVPAGTATDRLKEDIHTACTKFEFTGLQVNQKEAGSNEDEGFVAFSYRSAAKPDEAAGQDAARDWRTTNEKIRFVRVDGVWQFVDYQRFEYNENELFAQPPQAVQG